MTQTQDNPLISIVTACYNSAETLGRAFDSVLDQKYRKVDYVVVDGASSDGTLDIIKRYQSEFQSRGSQFRWISEPDDGIYHAMNKGIAMAQGDIIGILNSDDFHEPHTLQVIADAYVEHPDAGIFYGILRVLQGDLEILVYRYRYENYLLDRSTGIYSAAQHPTCFVRPSVYERIGGFDTTFSVAADHDFLIRAMQAGVKFHALDTILSNFTKGGASDQMSDYERHKQRYGVWYKNGLLSEKEYERLQGNLRYKKYKELKRRFVRWIFQFKIPFLS